MEKLNLGVIGLGHWGPNIVRNLASHPRVRIVGVCDLEESALDRIRSLLAFDCIFTRQAEELIENPAVDAIVVVTPASTHYNLVRSALQAKKHVFCEKPLTLSVDQDAELCDLAYNLDLKLMVGYTFLFNNGILKLSEMLQNDLLGQVYYLTATRTHMGLIREDASVVWDLAPHDVSIMNFLMNSCPERVSAVGGQPLGLGKPDLGFINLFYPNGVIGQIQVSWVDSNKERQVRIIGSKARVVFDDLNSLEPVRFYEKGIGLEDRFESDFGAYRFLLRDGDILSPRIEQTEPLKAMVDGFVRVVLDDAPNLANGSFAQEVTRVVVAVHQSIEQNGAPVTISR